MAKVLLINPVVREEDTPKHIPYGIALLAAIADKEGHQVQIFDANAWRPSDAVLKDVMQADDWDAIGIGGISTVYGYTKKLLKAAQDYSPRSLIIVGGGMLTAIPQDIMRLMPEIHVGAVGEGFVTFQPEVTRLFPVSDWQLQRATESEADLMHRRSQIIAATVDLPD